MLTHYHNPSKIPKETVGEGYCLLTTDQLDKPLPEGAEYWNPAYSKWIGSRRAGNRQPNITTTYRIPLSLSDRLRSERDRLDEQIRVVEAVEKGAEWEIRAPEQSIISRQTWSEPDNPLEWFLSPERECKWQVRLKPTAPTQISIPWTLETHPDVACVKRKTDDGKEPVLHPCITNWGKESVFIQSYGWILYTELHSDWLQRNGQPAGQEVQG